MRRILIIRLSAMGDILHALPAATALRKALPDAFLGWVIEERWAELIRAASVPTAQRGPAMPLVDKVHCVDTRAWRKSPLAGGTRRAILALRRELREQQYDAALDLQGAIRSAVIAKFSRAQLRAGAAEPRERMARWFYTRQMPTSGVHVVEQAVETAAALVEWPLTPLPAQLPIDPEAEIWCKKTIAGKERFLVINPGAGWGAKCWPPERFGAVATELAGEGWHVFVNVGPEEHDLGKQVADSAEGRAEPISCSVGQLISLTRRAALFIGGDTGPMHLAAALRVPVVGIFGPTDPRRNGPYGTRKIVLRNPESKRDHTRRSEPEAGLLTITISQVLDAARMLLEGK